MLANKNSPADKDAAGKITVDMPPVTRISIHGRVDRLLGDSFVPASEDPGSNAGVATRDVVVDRRTGVAARLFLPVGPLATGRRLPLVLYFHGGGSSSAPEESAFSRTYHRRATSLAARTSALVVSVEYNLPAAYDDAWTALRWAAAFADPWLLYHADRRRTFVVGDGRGGNVAYRTAARASRDGVDIDVEGLVLLHPCFRGPEWLPAEQATAGRAGKEEEEGMVSLRCRRVLVAIAEKDAVQRERGRRLVAYMRSGFSGCGVEVTIVEVTGSNLHGPPAARAGTDKLMQSLVEFVNKKSAATAPSVSNGSAVSAEVPPRRTEIKSCL